VSKAIDNLAKLASFIFVDEPRFGVAGDGTTDDSEAIQAIIDDNPGKTICFTARKTYRLESTLTVSDNNTRLVTLGGQALILNATTDGDAFHFECATDGQWEYLANCALEGFYIYRATTASAGAGIRLTRCNTTKVRNVYILNVPEGIVVEGGQLNSFDSFSVFASSAMTDLSATTDSALFKIIDSPTAGSTYQPAYTVRVSDFTIAAGGRTQCAMLLAQADGLQVGVGYIARGAEALVRMKPLRESSYIAGVNFTSCYFDGVYATTDLIDFPSDGFSSTAVAAIDFAACTIANAAECGVKVRRRVEGLTFSAGAIRTNGSWAIDHEVSSAVGSVSVMGTMITGNSTEPSATTGAVRFDGIGDLTMNTVVRGTLGTGAAYLFDGPIGRVSVSGTASGNAGSLFDKSGATIGTFGFSVHVSGSSSSFTPTLTFGGAAVGMTGTFLGRYAVVGGRCVGECVISLTSKGSSTGNLAIAGLPHAPAFDSACSILVTPVASGLGDVSLHGRVNATDDTIELYKMSGTSAARITDSDLSDTSALTVSFNYMI
jgi:hypothetical protein